MQNPGAKVAKYKTLKSVAHNLGHSFLSDMNCVADRRQKSVMVPQQIYDLAREHDLSDLEIDFLSETIVPEAFATYELRSSVGHYRLALPDLVERQGGSWDRVRAVTLELRFDLSREVNDGYEPERALPVFECRVEILDDRDVVHVGEPQNWWTTTGGPLRESRRP